MIFSNGLLPTEIGKVIKIGTGKYLPKKEDKPEGLEDDEEIIDYFLENNVDWQVCEYFLQGNCKYGDRCMYKHPKSMNSAIKDYFKDSNQGYTPN